MTYGESNWKVCAELKVVAEMRALYESSKNIVA